MTVLLCCLILLGSRVVAQPVIGNFKVAFGQNDTASVARPDGITAGDLMLVTLSFKGGSTISTVTPDSGWTIIRRTNAGSNVGLITYYKIATAREKELYHFALSAVQAFSIGLSRITGAMITATPIDATSASTGDVTTNESVPSLTTTVNNTLVLTVFANDQNTAFPPAIANAAGYTLIEQYDFPNTTNNGPSNMLSFYPQLLEGSTPSVSAVLPDETDGPWVAQQIALKAPATLTLNAPPNFTTNLRAAYTVTRSNTSLRANLTVNLSTTEGVGQFYTTASSSTPITSITIPAGQPSITFYFGTSTPLSYTVTASASGFVSATDAITSTLPPSLLLSTPSDLVAGPSRATYVVTRANSLTSVPITVNLSTTPGGGSFYTVPSQGTPKDTLVINAGQTSRVFFFESFKAANYKITAAAENFVSGEDLINVNPGAPAKFVVTPSSTRPVAGSKVTLTAQLSDTYNNPIPSAALIVNWTKTTVSGTLSSSSSPTNANGAASVVYTSPTAANDTVTVSAANGSFSGRSALIRTVAGPASGLVITGSPTQVSGSTQSIVVTAKDVYNNTDTTYTGKKSLLFSGPTPALIGSPATVNGIPIGSATELTFTKGVSAPVPLALYRAETTLLEATDDNLNASGDRALRVSVGVGPLSLARSSLSATPSSLVGNGLSQSTLTVQLKDASGNPLASSTDTLRLALTPTIGTLSAVTNDTKGTYTAIYTAGVVTNTTSVTVSGSLNSQALQQTAFIQLLNNSARRLSITTAPPSVVQNGVAFTTQPGIQLRKADQTEDPVLDVNVTVTIDEGGGDLYVGTTKVDPNVGATIKTNGGGLAAFSNLRIVGAAGVHKLRFSAPGYTSIVSEAIQVTAGTPNRLVFRVQPPTPTVAGERFSKAIELIIEDMSGNLVTTATDEISLSLTGSQGAVPLLGTTKKKAIGGLASFNTLSTQKSGLSYILTASSGSLTSAVSTAFDILPAPLSLSQTTVLASPVTLIPNGINRSSILVQLKDAFGNNLSNTAGELKLSLLPGSTGSLKSAGNSVYYLQNGAYTDTLVAPNSPGFATIRATLTQHGVITQTANVLFVNPTVTPTPTETNLSQLRWGATSTGYVKGTNIDPAASVYFIPSDGLSVSNYRMSGAGQLNFDVAVSPGASLNDRQVYIKNPSTEGVNIPGDPIRIAYDAPSFTSLSPEGGIRGNPQLEVTLEGAHFFATTDLKTAVEFSNGIRVLDTQVVSGGRIKLTLDLSTASVGTASMTLRNTPNGSSGGSTSVASVFQVINLTTPIITSIQPALSEIGKTVSVKISGSNFTGGTTLSITGSGVTLGPLAIYPDSIRTTFTVANLAEIGPRTVVITNTGATSVTAQTNFSVTLPAPTHNASKWPTTPVSTSGNPEFEWLPVNGATSYALEVSDKSHFGDNNAGGQTFSFNGLSGNVYKLTGTTLTPGNYFWRVRSVANNTPSAWSASRSFTVVPLPAAPLLLIPANAATVSSVKPSFSWQSSSNASTYTLQISTTPGFNAPLYLQQTDLAGTSFTLASNLSGGSIFYWRISGTGIAGTGPWSEIRTFTRAPLTDLEEDPESAPKEFYLRQNFPNPFNPSTQIAFGLPEATTVTLEVYSIQGQRVATLLSGKALSAGHHQVTFNAAKLGSGMYLYRLITPSYQKTGKMVLLK